MKQQSLVEPRSRAAISPPRPLFCTVEFIIPFNFLAYRLSGFLAGECFYPLGLRRLANDKAVGQPQIKDPDVSLEHSVLAFVFGEAGPSLGGIGFRQADINTALELDIPPPPADPHRRLHQDHQFGLGLERFQQLGGMGGRVLANDQGQIRKTPQALINDYRALFIDEGEFALVLPKSQGPAFSHA